LTASAGVSFNKFLAKIGSDFKKPNGLTVITPQNARGFLNKLTIGKFYGVGKITEKKMIALGIKTGKDLYKISKDFLTNNFGKQGLYLYDVINLNDNRAVNTSRKRKSVSKEITLREDTNDIDVLDKHIEYLSEIVNNICKKNRLYYKTIVLKIKYFNFKQITRCKTLEDYSQDNKIIEKNSKNLIFKANIDKYKVRLIGVGVSNLKDVN